MKRIVVLSSYVATSRVGGGVALLAGHALGVDPYLIPTTMLGRHPGLGAPGGGGVFDEMFASMIAGAKANGALEADAILTGYFASPAQVETAAAFIDQARAANPDVYVTVDPIMGDVDRGLYIGESTAEAIEAELIPRADLSTPNLWEFARCWSKSPIDRLDHAETVAKLAADWDQPILVTSAPTNTGEIGAIYRDDKGAWMAGGPLLCGAIPNGTGDALAFSMTSFILHGDAAELALSKSIGLVHTLLDRAQRIGDNDLPISASFDILKDPPRAKATKLA